MKADYITPPCCDKQSIAVMDYRWPMWEEPHEIKVNRMCTHCGTHWAGFVGQVKQFTRRQWETETKELFRK